MFGDCLRGYSKSIMKFLSPEEFGETLHGENLSGAFVFQFSTLLIQPGLIVSGTTYSRDEESADRTGRFITAAVYCCTSGFRSLVRFDSVVGRSSRRMRGTDRHPNLVSSRSASIPPAFTLVKRASAPKR